MLLSWSVRSGGPVGLGGLLGPCGLGGPGGPGVPGGPGGPGGQGGPGGPCETLRLGSDNNEKVFEQKYI